MAKRKKKKGTDPLLVFGIVGFAAAVTIAALDKRR